MILSALKYVRYRGEPREWNIEGKNNDYAYFRNINLLVGKNASGKSRTLNLIREIANLLAGKIDLNQVFNPTEYFELVFTEDDRKYIYKLDVKDRAVVGEVLFCDDKLLLDRNNNILLDKNVLFDIEDFQLAITQHDAEGKPYFDNFKLWGNTLKNYLFADHLIKNQLVKDFVKIEGDDWNIDDPDVLLHTFYKAKELFGDVFISEVIADMKALEYDISKIDIHEAGGGYGLFIEESGKYIVSQQEMSQGMFRALSLFIMLAYSRLSKRPLCLLIDDIGEGLDFESSQIMIDIVVNKINESNIQFFMATNDRYVMNHIALPYWSVIDREKNKSIFYDYMNSKDTFTDFNYTGLNNFDFLATDFYKKGFGTIDEEDNY